MFFNRRIGSAWVAALLFPFFAMSANAAAQSLSPSPVRATFWAGTGSEASMFVLEFGRSGKFRYIPATGVVSRGRWKQIGDSYDMEINGSFVRFSATIHDESLTGEATRRDGVRWRWTATKQPPVLSSVAPTYPPIAVAARASGNVIVDLKIDAAGDVLSARAISGHPLLVQTSVLAGRQWKFVSDDGSAKVRVARLIFSFRSPANGKTPEKVPTSVFLSPYQALINPVRMEIQYSYSTARLK
ncbi:MAG: periplasmic protein TonB [Acidobacteriota bacterium]|jgi:hypothetical protein|nr:periplasmic protein TonB [Acidobacteriota bacterium]